MGYPLVGIIVMHGETCFACKKRIVSNPLLKQELCSCFHRWNFDSTICPLLLSQSLYSLCPVQIKGFFNIYHNSTSGKRWLASFYSDIKILPRRVDFCSPFYSVIFLFIFRNNAYLP